MTLKEEIYKYAKDTYQATPEQPFPKFPSYTALRHEDNKKIYGMFTHISRKKLGIEGDPDEYVDILNMKCDPDMKMMLSGQKGVLPPYHMKAGNWITVVLDGSLSLKQIIPLLDLSYHLTSSGFKSKNGKPHNPYWVIPANPKYYDIESEIEQGRTEFIWHQKNSICTGDTVYLYITAPVAAIRYEFRVVEADIPYTDKNTSAKKAMNLKLINTFEPEAFPMKKLKTYGVNAVRSPRTIPASLHRELQYYVKSHS